MGGEVESERLGGGGAGEGGKIASNRGGYFAIHERRLSPGHYEGTFLLGLCLRFEVQG